MSLNWMILCCKLKNGLWEIVTKSQVVDKFNVTKSRLHCITNFALISDPEVALICATYISKTHKIQMWQQISFGSDSVLCTYVQCNLDLVTLNLLTTCDLVTILQRPFFNLLHKIIRFSDVMQFSDSFCEDQRCH